MEETDKSNRAAETFSLSAVEPPEYKSGQVSLYPSAGLKSWMNESKVSFVFNTYHIGKVFMVGLDDLGQLMFSDASFPRAMGLSYSDRTLWMGGLKQLWRFENFLAPGQMSGQNDAVFVPLEATTTGLVNVHDVRASGSDVYFVSCNFNCIAKRHPKWSFEPLWKPSFISEFAYGDRCHLNCLALEDGQPRYVTCFTKSDENLGWRRNRKRGDGIIIDVQNDRILCDGLDMPHSPQIHQNRLFVANSGKGEFGEVNRKTGRYTTICFIPGFTRGVSFWQNYALVGTSKPRRHGVFEGNDDTPLNARLTQRNLKPQCSISVVNLDTGEIEHQLVIEGSASEIYDVCLLPGIRRPLIVDLESQQASGLFRPSRAAI